MQVKRKAAKVGVIAALSAVGLFASATNAFADSICAYFNPGQADWNLGTSWGGAGNTYLIFQTDGNLVLYQGWPGSWDGSNPNHATPTWASGTEGWNSGYIDWSASNGGIVIEDKYHTPMCYIGGPNDTYAARHGGGFAKADFAQIQNDGNFVFYQNGYNPVWATSWTHDTLGHQFNYCR